MAGMGFQFGLESGKYCKRNHRWIFTIPQVCGDQSAGANALPPKASARPHLSFKEMEVRHVSEDVYYPCKPEWKPITITLYDLATGSQPVFTWIKNVYDPTSGSFVPPNSNNLIQECSLTLLDGCGSTVETWTFEDAWPAYVNFQTLDMDNSGIVLAEISLRYARAYVN